MKSFSGLRFLALVALLAHCPAMVSAQTGAAGPFPVIDLGSRRELFVDDFLIDKLDNVRLELQHPQPQEVVFACDQPWEGNTCIYFRIIPDGGKFRMWYQGAHWQFDPKDPKGNHPYHLCYAESDDGLKWTKPNLGLIEADGSKENNICLSGFLDNCAPFRDDNPDCPPEAKFKAIGYAKEGLIAWQSPDGIRWQRLGDQPIIKKGFFDSQNTAFWDPEIKKYRAYIRDFHDGLRDNRLAFSSDFREWTVPEMLNISPPVPGEQFYTNCISRYPRASHLFIGYPARYVERGWSPSMKALPDLDHREIRAKAGQRIGTAISDGVFMSSRDGFNFHRWPEAFLRIGPERPGSWVYGDCYAAHGLIETDSPLGSGKEFSLFIPEKYWRTGMTVRRHTLRIDGFVAAKAPLSGGQLLTKPITFSGQKLMLNFATSAAGSLRVELTDLEGKPLPGFALADCDETFGDSLDRAITWNGKPDVASLSCKSVRLRFQLNDADLYSFQFAE